MQQQVAVAPQTPRAGAARVVVMPLVAAVVVGLAAGVLTSYAQLWLPEGFSSLANSAASWCVVAGLVALLARSTVVGAVAGTVALLGMDVGYGIGSELRGYTYSTQAALFWAAAALVVGPVVGAGAQWLRQDRPRLAPLAAAVLAGVVVGEGAYGLLVVAESTTPAYWVGQIVLGVAGLAAVCALVLRTPRRIAVAVVGAVVTAAAFVVLYSLPLLLLLY